MEMDTPDAIGTHYDGSPDSDYCIHCFRDGLFTHQLDVEGQAALNLSSLDEWNREHGLSLSAEEAGKCLVSYLRTLKRWMPVEEKSSWILDRAGYATLSTIMEDGFPRPVSMDVLRHDGIRELWMTTDRRSRKVRHILSSSKAGISFVHEGDSVSLTGNAEIVDDREVLRGFWRDSFKAYFPMGPDDPGYVLIRFRTSSAVFWIDREKGCIRYE